MKDVILIVGMALTFLFGWFLMEQLDRFLYENQKRIRLDTMEFATFWCYNTIKRGGETVQNNENNLSKEHILVCLSSSPSNERIVRMAGKMAQAFCGSLTALYVQTPGYSLPQSQVVNSQKASGIKEIHLLYRLPSCFVLILFTVLPLIWDKKKQETFSDFPLSKTVKFF